MVQKIIGGFLSMEDEELIKITPDNERVKSILEMVKLREKRIDSNKDEKFSTLLI